MLDQVQALFDLRPEIDLDLMRPGQSLNDLAARSLQAIDGVLREVRPDWLLVQGDTTTAMAGALAAFHLGLNIGHVEAGLRSGDLRRPFPEEANRRVIDMVAAALFAPTRLAGQRLLAEGAEPSRVYFTGNTVIDALHHVSATMADEPTVQEVLVTVHRRESFGEPIRQIFSALRELAATFPEVRFVFPVHRNPSVRGPANELLGDIANLSLLEPLSYRDLVRHLRRAKLVLTDSGGIQEEAPAFGKPVLVLRETTERPEGVAAGVATLVGVERATIVAEATRLLSDPAALARMAKAQNPYGDGHAAERIAAILAGEPWSPLETRAAASS
jgi:UDP-N-acetylglucosamine 2-epimerase (non-hydrolysing)